MSQFNAELFTLVLMIIYIEQLYLTRFFYSNRGKIEAGIGFDFLVMLLLVLHIISSLIISVFINWFLSLILLFLLIFVSGASFLLGKVFVVIESIHTSNFCRSLSKKRRMN